MKKQILLILFLALVSLNINSQQCLSTTGCSNFVKEYPTSGAPYTPTSSWQVLNNPATGSAAIMNGGNWTRFNVVSGNTYEWTYCEEYGGVSTSWDAQLTLYNNANTTSQLCFSTDVCGTKAPYISWTANFTGVVRLLTTAFVGSVGCQSNSGGSNKLAYRQIPVVTCTTPGTPLNVTGTQTGQTTANLSWSAGSPAGSSTVTYYWVIGTSSSVVYNSGIVQGSTIGTSASVSGLTAGTTYYLKVFANTSCNNTSSSYGNTASFTTTPAVVCITPGTPLNVTGTQTGQTTANLSWSAGSPLGSSTVTYYWVIGTNSSVVYNSGVAQGSTTGTSASVSGLTAGTTYYLKVFANTSCNNTISSYGNTASFTTSSATICTTPGTPASAIGTSTGQTSANLSWTAGSPTGSSNLTYYWVVGTTSSVTYGGSGVIAQGTTSGTSVTTSALTCGTTYYLRVYAYTDCNGTSSGYKTSASFTTTVCSGSSSVYGIDVSHYQGTINWTQVKSLASKNFAFVKATEGMTVNDDYFTTNMINGKNAGIIMGAYHLARPDNNAAIDEANHFVDIASSYIGNNYLPPALDLEPLYVESLGKVSLSTWVQAWINQVKSRTLINPVIYTTHYDAANLLNSSLNSSSLWIANYETNPISVPTNLGIWSSWAFNQYSEQGVVSGISGSVDLDIFNGDMTALNNLIGGSSTGVLCGNDTPCGPPAPVSLPINSSYINMSCSTVGATTTDIVFIGNSGTAYQSSRYDDDVWFTLTPTNTKPITITVTPTSNISNFDVVVGVYSGNCSSTTQVSCADVNPAGVSEKLFFTPTVGTPYLVRVFSYGIGSTYSGDFDICACNNCTSGLDDISSSDKIKIYPNPTTGKFEISEIEVLGDKCKIEIFNHIGAQIYVSENENIGNKISLDLSTYPVGMYIVKLSNNGVSYQKKVSKK